MKDLKNDSIVYFKDAQVTRATNDGMELLGHFLLSQVGAERNAFFTKWLKEGGEDDINAGPYLVEKRGKNVTIDYADGDDVTSFETSKENLIEIIKHWHGWCSSDSVSACKVGGFEVSISRSTDSANADLFDFKTHKVH